MSLKMINTLVGSRASSVCRNSCMVLQFCRFSSGEMLPIELRVTRAHGSLLPPNVTSWLATRQTCKRKYFSYKKIEIITNTCHGHVRRLIEHGGHHLRCLLIEVGGNLRKSQVCSNLQLRHCVGAVLDRIFCRQSSRKMSHQPTL